MNIKEMTQRLEERLEIKIKNIDDLRDYVKDSTQALIAARELQRYIDSAETGLNIHFCREGVNGLKGIYRSLCEKFPEIQQEVGFPYD